MKDIQEILREFYSSLPKFEDGRINYAGSTRAAVVTVFVEFAGKILLLKRSEKVSTYKGKWNTVAGYLDELKDPREKALQELKEELGVTENQIKTIKEGDGFEFEDRGIGKTWLVSPFLAILREKPGIKLDFEHTEYVWIEPTSLKQYDIVPNLETSWKKVNFEKE